MKLLKFTHTHTRIYRHTHWNTRAIRKTNQKQKEEQGEGCYGGSSSLPAPPLPTPPRISHPSVLIRKKANTSIISELPCNRKGGNSLSLFIYLFIYFAVLVLFFFLVISLFFPVLRTHFPLFFLVFKLLFSSFFFSFLSSPNFCLPPFFFSPTTLCSLHLFRSTISEFVYKRIVCVRVNSKKKSSLFTNFPKKKKRGLNRHYNCHC